MPSNVYKAIADPSRRKILQLLRNQDYSAGELAEHFEFTKPTLSRHLSVLRSADLVDSEKQGNRVIYRLNVSVLEEALLSMMNLFQISVSDLTDEPSTSTEN